MEVKEKRETETESERDREKKQGERKWRTKRKEIRRQIVEKQI